MFTGIVAAVGRIESLGDASPGLRVRLASPWDDLAPGESVAVDGACLTVTAAGEGWFEVQVVDTSLDRTRFAECRVADPVNLERALRVGDRLGGHMVQGHVDAVGRVRSVTERVDARVVDLEVPAAVAEVSVPLGSITVDGVSLTVVARPAPDVVQVSLVPFTLQHTTLGRLAPGTRVHLEGDLIGKYVKELLRPRLAAEAGPGA